MGGRVYEGAMSCRDVTTIVHRALAFASYWTPSADLVRLRRPIYLSSSPSDSATAHTTAHATDASNAQGLSPGSV